MNALARFDRPAVFIVASIPPVIVLLLLAITIWTSFVEGAPGLHAVLTLRNYVALYADPFTYHALLNTAGFAVTMVCVSMAFGVPIAWLVERTDLPGKPFILVTMVVGVAMPGFLIAMGWVVALHPRIGILNVWLKELFDTPWLVINISTVLGMGWVQGLALAPLAFVMVSAAFRSMNPAFEDAAQVHGLGRLQILRRVTLPLAAPALAAACIYLGVIGMGAFDIPAVIGLGSRIYTFSTLIFVTTFSGQTGMQDYGIPAAVGTMMLVLAVLISIWYSRYLRATNRYHQISGRDYRPRLIPLGRWRVAAWAFCGTYLTLACGMPVASVVWASFLPYIQPPSAEALSVASLAQFYSLDWELMWRGARNTATLVVVVPVATVLLAIPLAWIVVRSRSRWRFMYEFFAFLPHAMPALIFALAALLISLFVLGDIVPLYGTIWLIAIIYVVEQMAFASRVMNSSLIQINSELDEAAYVSGLSLIDVLRRIVVPILLPTILVLWIWLALGSFRELTIATLLSGRDSITLPVVIWNFWIAGGMGLASAAVLIMLVIMAPLVILYWTYYGRKYL